MNRSVASKASNASSRMLQQLASRSQAKIFRSQGSFNDQEMRVIWNAIGLYISRNLRMGRGVNIPKLGIFTFTPPQVRLKGVTNERQRDQRPRTPVFLIHKEFIKGMSFKTAVFYHQQFGMGLRPYAAFGSTGDVPITKMNIAQISSYANMSKDSTQIALGRMIKYLSQKLSHGGNLNFQIPNVGTLISKGNLVAVRFNEFLNRDTRTILSKSVDQRKQKGLMNLTSDNLKKLSNFNEMTHKLQNKSTDFLEIDDSAKRYLNETMGLHFNQSFSGQQGNIMKRSMTGFDRSFATKPFDRTNSQLKSSQLMKMTASMGIGFGLTNKINNFNRQYNLPLKIVKQWVYDKCVSTQQSFKDFCKISGSDKPVLIADDVWAACKQISSDITQQQSQQLFRLLDYNKDGYVTQEDWLKNIDFDNNKVLKQFASIIKVKKLSLSEIMKIMKIQGAKSVNVYHLKDGIRRICKQSISDSNALSLSRYLCKGKHQLPIQNLLQILNISDYELQQNNKGKHSTHKDQSRNGYNNNIDHQWQLKFLKRVNRKMNDKGVYPQTLLNKLRFYDVKLEGFIDQTQFKSVLTEIGIGLTLSQLIKIVKVFPINQKNQIDYREFMDRVTSIDNSEIDNNSQEISQVEFNQKLKALISSNSQILSKLPISIARLGSQLQSLPEFNSYSEAFLLPCIKKIDINHDNQISAQDIKAFKNKYLNLKQIPVLESHKVSQLFIKLKEKSIKKKISYLDVFRQIDTNGNGFITREQWNENLSKIIQLTQTERENMFNQMNRKSLDMIDQKTFLSFISCQGSDLNKTATRNDYEQFDWVEDVMQKIHVWYHQSKLTLEDGFRIIDKDSDTYINDQDLIAFLTNRIKVNTREISLVRVQKLIKVLDTFKKGKLSFLDWKNFIQNSKNEESSTQNPSKKWISQAKQQIGIILSRKYPSLEQAFTDITQGDAKLLFASFQKWIRQNKILSGFMINDDILKQLYSALDQHKKGYILEDDFVSSFSSYHWKIQHIKEFIQQLVIKFKTCEEAFKYFVGYANGVKSLKEPKFYESSKKIFGTRFSNADLKNIWKTIASGKSQLKYSDFQKKYKTQWKQSQNVIENTFPKDSWVYKDFSIIKGTQTRGTQFQYSETQKMEQQVSKIIDNVKDMLSTSAKTLEQAFAEVDKQKSGKVTNLQFKKAFRILNIALTSKQIDLLLNYCNFKLESLIDCKAFIKMLNIRQQKKAIFQRMLPKIQKLSDMMHYYMVSPKDAFKKWNNPRSGYMVFDEFYKLIEKLYTQAEQKMPEYQLIKQLFEYIDIRKDGHIDYQQYTQVFRNCKPPSLLMGTTPANGEQLIFKMSDSKQLSKPTREQSVPLFKHSPSYEEFVNLIGRNRRFIQTEIEKISTQTLVPFDVVEKIVKEFADKQKFHLEQGLIRNLLAFSMTGEKVDYRLMLNDLKQRSETNVEHPKKNFF